MGQDRWSYDVAVVAESSSVLRVDAARLLEAAERRPGIREMMLRFASSFTAQMGRTIVSNLIHCVEQRTARWILLYQDRVHSDEVVTITHEEMGFMLGVRRASITDALHALESDGAIRSLRGQIIIRDRARLEALAAETYGFAEAEYQRLIGPFDDRPCAVSSTNGRSCNGQAISIEKADSD
ncbi:Crp/Fnr family transcriptional regulator [Sphingomonas ginkgonis]|uniref:Crp/Fnr family transcriptional regulator n=1 Tax=Sphingomonas ginkgonis TaxID=2315330 RepID=A0A429V679_9SPHN|nr:Crp/Fnr family transcriptional regulator [Sphingomonas ginkgonis]RST29456.1 Crp/Fnr family transcriptional regulator [Sphingomonas ginkgonis]